MAEKSTLQCQIMFDHANAFSNCADFCAKGRCEDPVRFDKYTAPEVVNISFSCEVYLKTLICYYGIELKRAHKLDSLFDLLPDENKAHIRNAILVNYGTLTAGFGIDLIQKYGDSFAEWRYYYEFSRSSSYSMDFEFMRALRNALREECSQVLFGMNWLQYKETLY